MKFLLIAAVSALRYTDLPHTGSVDTNADNILKIDPLSRYVNDDDLVQINSQVRYMDLPAVGQYDTNADNVEKLDPLSRYVNDDDI